jgi:hypothetical protein
MSGVNYFSARLKWRRVQADCTGERLWRCTSIVIRLSYPLRDRCPGLVESERDHPLKALRPCDEYPDTTPGRVRGNPAFIRLSKVLPAAASTAAPMRSRLAAEIPLQSNTVRGMESRYLADPLDGPTPLLTSSSACARFVPITNPAIGRSRV